MCRGCWKEVGSPTAIPSNFDEFARLYREVYDRSPVGGALHIQLDDMNLEDEDMEFDVGQEPNEYEIACMEQMRAMTTEERYASIAKIEGWI